MDREQRPSRQQAQRNNTGIGPDQVAITSRDHVLAQSYGLGEPQEKYVNAPTQQSSGCVRFIMLSFSLLIGLAMTGSALTLWIEQNQDMSPVGNIVLFSIGLMVLLSALVYSPLWPHLASSYLICTDGLLCRKPLALKDREQAIRWDQISEYYTDVSRLKLVVQDDASGGSSRDVLIVLGNFSRSGGASRGIDAIIGRVTRVMIPQMAERFEQGELLTFGPFTASQGGIEYKEQHFDWQQIARCTMIVSGFRLTFLLIGRDGQRLASYDCSRIPNLPVLHALIEATLEER